MRSSNSGFHPPFNPWTPRPAQRHWWRFIEDGPEDAHLFHGLDELMKFHRLPRTRSRQLVAPDQILVFAEGSHHHHGNHFEPGIGLDLTQHIEAVHSGHLQIERDDCGLPIGASGELTKVIEGFS